MKNFKNDFKKVNKFSKITNHYLKKHELFLRIHEQFFENDEKKLKVNIFRNTSHFLNQKRRNDETRRARYSHSPRAGNILDYELHTAAELVSNPSYDPLLIRLVF